MVRNKQKMNGKVGNCTVGKRKDGFSIRYSIGTRSGSKLKRKWDNVVFESDLEAVAAIPCLIKRLNEPSTHPRASPTRDIVPKMSDVALGTFKLIKRRLGLVNLTRRHWFSCNLLMNINKFDDLSRKSKRSLKSLFNPTYKSVSKSLEDSLRYLEALPTTLRNTARDLEEKVALLNRHMKKDTTHELLLIEPVMVDPENFDCSQLVFKKRKVDSVNQTFCRIPADVISARQHIRLHSQIQMVKSLTIKLIRHRLEEAGAYETFISRSNFTEDDLTTFLSERNLKRQSMVTFADEVIADNSLVGCNDDDITPSRRTLMMWFSCFNKFGGFKEDGRGKWIRQSPMKIFPSLQHSLTLFSRTTKHVTVESTKVFINNLLRSNVLGDEGKEMIEFLEQRGISLKKGICRRTTYNWMISAGMEYKESTITYYTDGHNRPDVVAYRNEYIDRRSKISLRQPLYVKVEGEDVHVDRLDESIYLEYRAKYKKGGQLHSNFALYAAEAKSNCEYGHNTGVCKCHLPIWHEGQDESCYKCHSSSKMMWIMKGEQKLLKKGEGVGLMFSASVSEERGFGFPLTQDEIDYVNSHEAWTGREKLKRSEKTPYGSAGLISFKYGSNREGYWDHEHFMQQCECFIAMFNILYPDRQLYYEADWSSGHAKMKEDGLNASKMNVGFGGKQQQKMRDSVMVDGCLGPNSLLKLGDTQVFVFKEGDIRPFDKSARENDYYVQQTVPQRRRDPEIEGEQLESILKEGYLNKPKGLKQVLYERGLLDETTTDKAGMIRKLSACPDFANEVSQIEELFRSHGHIVGMTPKCHPELAGCGIEYCWGKSKLNFRRHINDFEPKNLHANCMASFDEKYLDIGNVRKFARKTRNYIAVYNDIREIIEKDAGMSAHDALELAKTKNEGDIASYRSVEHHLKKRKCHRNIIDIDSAIINSVDKIKSESNQFIN